MSQTKESLRAQYALITEIVCSNTSYHSTFPYFIKRHRISQQRITSAKQAKFRRNHLEWGVLVFLAYISMS
ncbi:hypothetical protein Y032_0183g966 [Ancylostoma ceylanicum]|uniref:Uncharacterized protein n=1 Tax=Ancylostoma ceylanicum TaxID=53326 RepID=A0A016SS72_9BILA|nr:hypothetical protein Y032_0183g966 [Ancylostoma ceylanicum]